VFCDDCSSLALAELDGAPLCEACILAAVAGATEHSLAGRIAPLHLVHRVEPLSDLVGGQSAFSTTT
jgi:hypothetical protein